LLGVWAVDALVSLAPSSVPRLNEVGLDPTVFAFAAALTIATGLLFGLMPAVQASQRDVAHALNDAARGGSRVAGRALRSALVVAEIALALVLLTGGALLMQTFVRLLSADLGFNPENVLVGFVNPPRTAYKTAAEYRAFYDQVLEKASALPGVQKAALASVLPLSGDLLFLLAVCAGLSFGSGFASPPLSGLASQMIDRSWQGRALGVMQSAGSAGRLLGPLLGGWLLMLDLKKTVTEYAKTPFLVGALLCLIGAVLAFCVKKPVEDKSMEPMAIG